MYFMQRKDNKIHGKYNLGGLRQNTYKHTGFKKRDQTNTKKLTKEDKELNRKIYQMIIVENIKVFVKRFKIV
ncbi:hypothetical protein AGMMS50222_10960 [Endomicrobiia bacterium]|nr:hypothetical protein AGMMS50222_10960 [Endomicrobiia bacterium]